MVDELSLREAGKVSSHDQVERVETHDDIHMNNRLAYKGDDSDGKVDWTFKMMAAALGLSALYCGSLMALSFIGACLSFVEDDLHAGGNGSWLPVANTLATSAIVPFVGYLQDALGRRLVTLVGVVLLIIGGAVVASAHTLAQGIVGMAVSGAGCGIAELTALAGISDIVPVCRRGFAIAMVGAMNLPLSPYVLYCQLVASRSTWRWTMWFATIWCGVVLIVLILTYFPKTHPRMEGMSRRKILARIDCVGAVLSIIGITVFLVALSAGGYTKTWTSGYVLGQLLVGLTCIIAWIIWEIKFAKFPMIPKELFKDQRIVAISYFVAFVGGMNFYSTLNFFPIVFSEVYDSDPLHVGLMSLGYSLLTTLAAVFFNGILSSTLRTGHILLFAATLMTAFGGAMAIANPTNVTTTIGISAVAGFGIGGIIVPSATVALIVCPDAILATAAALSIAVRTIGGSIGFTIYYNIFITRLKAKLPELVAEHAIKAGLPLADAKEFVTTFILEPTKIASAPGFSPEIAEGAALGTKWAFAYALKYVWYTSIPFGIVAMIGCVLLPSTEKYQTNRIAAAI